MESEHLFKFGKIEFVQTIKFDLADVNYQIVPRGYLVQDINNPKNIYMFNTYVDMEDYFTDYSKLKY